MDCLWEIMCVLNDTLRALHQLFSFMIILGLFDGRLYVCVWRRLWATLFCRGFPSVVYFYSLVFWRPQLAQVMKQ